MAVEDHNATIDDALAIYFERLDAGESIDMAALLQRFPSCAAELNQFFANELGLNAQLVELQSRLLRKSSNNGPMDSRLRVRCPHCHQPTQVAVDTELAEITCGSCGSRFGLVDQGQETVDQTRQKAIGRFELIERLGMGSFGTVWKARDKELDRIVAVKIPRQTGMSREEQEKFLREARAAAQLSHPNIVSVHEVGRDGGSIYIVSDFVRGLTLADWLTGQQPTSREAAELCAKIADALDHAHEKGIVHRDLKPANIMLDDELAPHIMDFGLARRDAGEITMTIDGHVLGTPAYMSPEQAEGKAHTADRRSDVYSLGVILFQLLTGELPFRGNSRMLIHQVLHDEPPSPRKLNSTINRDLETVTLKCLEKDAANRYQSAGELAAELRRYLSHEPIRARPISRFGRAWRWAKRKPAIATLSAAVAVLLVCALSVLAVSNARIRQESKKKNDALDIAQSNAEIAQRRYYAAQMNLAGEAWRNSDHARTVQLLETLRPAPGEKDLRGFEWRHLYHLSHSNLVKRWRSHSSGKEVQIRDIEWPQKADWFASVVETDGIQIWNADSGESEFLFNIEAPANINDIAATPDGQLLAAALTTGEVVVWDVPSRQQIARWMAHPQGESGVRAIDISSDKKLIATGTRGYKSGEPGGLALWDPHGQRLPGFEDVSQWVGRIKFSPDCSALAAAGYEWEHLSQKSISIWDVRGLPKKRGEIANCGASNMAFTLDSKYLWCAGNPLVRQLDVESAAERKACHPYIGPINAVACLPDANRIVVGGADRVVQLLDQDSGNPEVIGADLTDISSIAISPSGDRVVSGDINGWLTLREIDFAAPIPTLHGNYVSHGRNDIRSIAFAPSGERLFVGTSPLNIVDSDTLHLTDVGPRGDILAISDNCRYVASLDSAKGKLVICNLSSDTEQTTLDVGDNNNAIFSRDSQLIATWSAHAPIPGRDVLRVWNAQTGEQTSLQPKKNSWIFAAAFSPRHNQIAIGSRWSAVDIMDCGRGTLIDRDATPVNNQHLPSTLEYSPDGKILGCGFFSGAIVLWNVDPDTGRIARRCQLHGHTTVVLDMIFSPDGSQLITASQDKSLRLWDVALGQETMTYGIHAKLLAFAPDGKSLAVVGLDNKVRILRTSRTATAENFTAKSDALKFATSEHRLGLDALAARDHRLATMHYERALALRRKFLGNDDPKTATVLSDLGFVLLMQGEYAEAKACLEKALAVQQKRIGMKDARTANTLAALCALYRETSDFTLGRVCGEKALAIRKELFGDSHIVTAYSLFDMARLLYATEQYTESLPYFDEALKIRMKVWGNQHPDMPSTYREYADALRKAGRHDEAAALRQRALEPTREINASH